MKNNTVYTYFVLHLLLFVVSVTRTGAAVDGSDTASLIQAACSDTPLSFSSRVREHPLDLSFGDKCRIVAAAKQAGNAALYSNLVDSTFAINFFRSDVFNAINCNDSSMFARLRSLGGKLPLLLNRYLSESVCINDVVLTKKLLEVGADVGPQNQNRPLRQAILHTHNPEMIALLLRHGASVTQWEIDAICKEERRHFEKRWHIMLGCLGINTILLRCVLADEGREPLIEESASDIVWFVGKMAVGTLVLCLINYYLISNVVQPLAAETGALYQLCLRRSSNNLLFRQLEENSTIGRHVKRLHNKRQGCIEGWFDKYQVPSDLRPFILSFE